MNYTENLAKQDLTIGNLWSDEYLSLSVEEQKKYKKVVMNESSKDELDYERKDMQEKYESNTFHDNTRELKVIDKVTTGRADAGFNLAYEDGIIFIRSVDKLVEALHSDEILFNLKLIEEYESDKKMKCISAFSRYLQSDGALDKLPKTAKLLHEFEDGSTLHENDRALFVRFPETFCYISHVEKVVANKDEGIYCTTIAAYAAVENDKELRNIKKLKLEVKRLKMLSIEHLESSSI